MYNNDASDEKPLVTDGEYFVNTYCYDENNNMVSMTHNKIIYNFKYDESGNVIGFGSYDLFTYTYDTNGNVVCIQNNDNIYVNYKYDNLSRLVREDNALLGKTYTFSYDKEGNILSTNEYVYTDGDISDSAVKTNSYVYDSKWKDLMVSYNGENITYDSIGNPVSYRDGLKFTWTNGRNLGTVTTSEGTNASYTYNKDGIRNSKTVDGKTTKYKLNDKNIVVQDDGTNCIWYMYDVEGFELNGEAYYYEKDLLNSIIGIYNSKGGRVVSYKYNSFGKIMSVEGDISLAVINPFRYRGYFYDEETGLYYLNSRYYDCETGRFINADSYDVLFSENVGDIREGNLFAYCYDNFVMYVDYCGEASQGPTPSQAPVKNGNSSEKKPIASKEDRKKVNSTVSQYGTRFGTKYKVSAELRKKQNDVFNVTFNKTISGRQYYVVNIDKGCTANVVVYFNNKYFATYSVGKNTNYSKYIKRDVIGPNSSYKPKDVYCKMIISLSTKSSNNKGNVRAHKYLYNDMLESETSRVWIASGASADIFTGNEVTNPLFSVKCSPYYYTPLEYSYDAIRFWLTPNDAEQLMIILDGLITDYENNVKNSVNGRYLLWANE